MMNKKQIIGKHTKEYSAIMIKRVKILKGEVREVAEAKGYKPEDLVIIMFSECNHVMKFDVEKIDGDAIVYLMHNFVG